MAMPNVKVLDLVDCGQDFEVWLQLHSIPLVLR